METLISLLTFLLKEMFSKVSRDLFLIYKSYKNKKIPVDVLLLSLITDQLRKTLVSFSTQVGLLNISSMEWANFVCCWDSLSSTIMDSSGFPLLHISSGLFQSSFFFFFFTHLKKKMYSNLVFLLLFTLRTSGR